MTNLQATRAKIRSYHLRDESEVAAELVEMAALSQTQRAQITADAVTLINGIRNDAKPSLMDVFLAEYGLSAEEGVALMCLAEALLRVPDAETIDALIEDKVAPSEWGKHLGNSSSSLVNASTWALMLTGKVLTDGQPGIAGVLRSTVKRLGEPVIRTAVARAMREMGQQFVLGQTIEEALKRGKKNEWYSRSNSRVSRGTHIIEEGETQRIPNPASNAIPKGQTESKGIPKDAHDA